MTKKQATLTIKPVAWSGEKPTKYQAYTEYPVSDKRVLRVLSSPKSTEEDAVRDLYHETKLWTDALKAFNKLFQDELDGKP